MDSTYTPYSQDISLRKGLIFNFKTVHIKKFDMFLPRVDWMKFLNAYEDFYEHIMDFPEYWSSKILSTMNKIDIDFRMQSNSLQIIPTHTIQKLLTSIGCVDSIQIPYSQTDIGKKHLISLLEQKRNVYYHEIIGTQGWS